MGWNRMRGAGRPAGVMSPLQAAFTMMEYARPYQRRLRATFVAIMVVAVALAAEPLVVAGVFGEVFGARRPLPSLAWLAAWPALAALRAAAVRCRDRRAARVAADVSRDLKSAIVRRQGHAVTPSKGIQAAMLTGVEAVNRSLAVALPTIANCVAVLLVGVLAAAALDWRVALLVVLMLGPISWLNVRLARRVQDLTAVHAKGLEQQAAEAEGFLHRIALEWIAVLGMVRAVVARTEALADVHRDVDEQRRVAQNYYPPTTIMGAVLAAVTVGVGALVFDVSQSASAGFLAFALRLIEQMVGLVIHSGDLVRDVAHVQMVRDALAVPIERTGGRRLEHARGEIVIRDATVTYRGGGRGLAGLSLVVEPGEALAVVGESGSGKTTLTRLLIGRVALERGSARLDGVELGELELARLREIVVAAPEDLWVFGGTVRENLFRPEGPLDDVEAACRVALIHDWIMERPGGYDSRIELGEVSGGEKQRLGVARVLLAEMPGLTRVAILDEPTARLSPAMSMRLMDAVLTRHARLGVTTLVDTHDPVVHRMMPRAVVLSEGTVIEDGDPRGLLMDPGSAYRRLSGLAG